MKPKNFVRSIHDRERRCGQFASARRRVRACKAERGRPRLRGLLPCGRGRGPPDPSGDGGFPDDPRGVSTRRGRIPLPKRLRSPAHPSALIFGLPALVAGRCGGRALWFTCSVWSVRFFLSGIRFRPPWLTKEPFELDEATRAEDGTIGSSSSHAPRRTGKSTGARSIGEIFYEYAAAFRRSLGNGGERAGRARDRG